MENTAQLVDKDSTLKNNFLHLQLLGQLLRV